MTDTLPSFERRHFLGLLASLPIPGRAGVARAAPILNSLDSATMLIAGPDNGSLDHWGQTMGPALRQGLSPEFLLKRAGIGGPDGVTGANQFDARGEPDGHTILLVPGEAMIAWLIGDPRAKYNVALWVSVMAGVTPGIVIARPGTAVPGKTVRLPTTSPASADLPAVLALDLLGVRVQPVPALPEEGLPAALTGGAIDAVFLRGHKVPEQAAILFAAGCQPVFTLGAPDDHRVLRRCKAFPEVPTAGERYAALNGRPTDPLFAAWMATAMASQLEFALVLPQLTPAAAVGMWRHAGNEAVGALDMQAMATALEVKAVGGPEATNATRVVAVNAPAQTELRRWLATRYHWHAT